MSWTLDPPEDWEIKVWENDGEPYATKKTPPTLFNKKGTPANKPGEVTFSASVKYNGGTFVLLDGVDHWVRGYRIPPPVPPEGFVLHDIAVGLQMNSRPPYATQLLKKIP